ncbi:hypothetical protein TNCV_2905241 [Trichonephila clavipes]|nr:hypothetical protein TNCV_2905241 [Trichonephila clavipes]
MDFRILNHGPLTRTTHELAPCSSNSTPLGGLGASLAVTLYPPIYIVSKSSVSESILTSHCSATQGPMAADLVILNHGQVTRTTPEPTPPSPNYYTTPMGGRFNSLRYSLHRSPTRWAYSGTGLEFMTRNPRSDSLTTRLPRLLVKVAPEGERFFYHLYKAALWLLATEPINFQPWSSDENDT